MSDRHEITDADRAIAARVHREMKFRYPPSRVTGARRFNMEAELARTAMLARTAALKPAAPDPEVGSIWQHYNGNRYQVIAIANQLDTEKYPKTIVHQNIRNNFVSARRADDWHRSYTYLGHWQGCDVATDSELSKAEQLRKEFEA